MGHLSFLSTPSARRATRLPEGSPRSGTAISIHALREEGDLLLALAGTKHQGISIHALREEGDVGLGFAESLCFCISIHALREEGDLHGALSDAVPGAFLSTPSARRATPYPPDREQVSQISIHALREEGDLPAVRPPLGDSKFLSTPSARRATTDPRSEGGLPHDFYPRPPRGGRPSPLHLHFIFLLFLSTPSARRATAAFHKRFAIHSVISIHALREEGDATI